MSQVDPTVSEANKAVVQQFLQELSQRQLDAVDTYVAADAVDHRIAPGTAPGIDGMKRELTALWRGFPDATMVIEQIVAEADRVAVRTLVTGTHLGLYLGARATGESVRWTSVDIYRLEGGKLVERWGMVDRLGMLQQMKVLNVLER